MGAQLVVYPFTFFDYDVAISKNLHHGQSLGVFKACFRGFAEPCFFCVKAKAAERRLKNIQLFSNDDLRSVKTTR